MMSLFIDAMELGYVPDPVVRAGIRHLCKTRLKSLQSGSSELEQEDFNRYVDDLRRAPIAVHTDAANRQHYEVPPRFFELVLGRNLKYSSCFWPEGCSTLDEAEDLALAETCARAELKDGMRILELGCGWGSLTLAMAARYPDAQIVALSNSALQREHIEAKARERGLRNVRVLTRNIVGVENLDLEFGKFDRVVSVEMFEHLQNYQILFERISGWLAPEGKLFVHVFTHRRFSYPFETEGEDNWMGKYFFTGGQMPAHRLLPRFQENLALEKDWVWNGTHYAKTADAWLENQDRHRATLLPIFAKVYGDAEAGRWFQRWRVFFLSCSELFGYQAGTEWGVSHYLFKNRS